MISHDFDRRTMRTPVSAWDPPAEALKLVMRPVDNVTAVCCHRRKRKADTSWYIWKWYGNDTGMIWKWYGNWWDMELNDVKWRVPLVMGISLKKQSAPSCWQQLTKITHDVMDIVWECGEWNAVRSLLVFFRDPSLCTNWLHRGYQLSTMGIRIHQPVEIEYWERISTTGFEFSTYSPTGSSLELIPSLAHTHFIVLIEVIVHIKYIKLAHLHAQIYNICVQNCINTSCLFCACQQFCWGISYHLSKRNERRLDQRISGSTTNKIPQMLLFTDPLYPHYKKYWRC